MSAQAALGLVHARLARLTLFLPGTPSREPEAFHDLPAALARLVSLAEGAREITFRMGRAAYPGFEDFPSITARADGEYLATLGGPWRTERHQTEARDELRRLAG